MNEADALKDWNDKGGDAETAKLRAALESIAGWDDVNLQREYEVALRDIIRSIVDCAKTALEASVSPAAQGE